MKDQELKPCPFCGCKPDILDENIRNEILFTIYCRDCRCQTIPSSKLNFITKIWNKRV